MHVLFIQQHFVTNRGRWSTKTYDFARYLVERGHRVTVLTGANVLAGDREVAGLIEREDVDGIRVIRVGIRYANQMGYGRRVAAFVGFAALSSALAVVEARVDVVLASSGPLTVGIPALVARLLRGRPFVFEVRDLWPEIPVAMGILTHPVLIAAARVAERTFYRRASAVVGISQGIVDRIEAGGVPRHKLAVIHTGVDLDLFDRTPADDSDLRRHGIADRFVAIYAGAISTVNHIGYLLDAAVALRDDPRIAIVILGEGKTRREMVDRARREGLTNVVFLPGRPKAELVGLLKACQLGIISGMPLEVFRPAMPNKYFDYLAAGIPVAANYEAEHNRHLERHGCGWEVTPSDPGALARLLREGADDTARMAAAGARGRELAERCYDRRRIVGDLERLLAGCATTRLEVWRGAAG